MRRLAGCAAVWALVCSTACEHDTDPLRVDALAARLTLPAGFQDQVVVSGLTQPTAVRFAKDGRVFIAEKSGLIKVYDPTRQADPEVFADLRTNVHNYWDRGLLDLELHPDFPDTPYLYVLYVYDGALGETAPHWGTPLATSDTCPSPPGATDLGCIASGRLSRLEAVGNGMRGGEQVMVENWPLQFPSHALGSLQFGPDGMLYASAGDGGSFDFVDYGQVGNALGDPPVSVGGDQKPPAARGGALRAQNVAVLGFPVRYNGKIIRVDPELELSDVDAAAPGSGTADAIVAIGLRNPFRTQFRPGTTELWIGDVGWSTWEEIDRLIDPAPGTIANFGWPCFEGEPRQPGYEAAKLDLCQQLYTRGGQIAPYFAYNHDAEVVAGDGCGTDQAAVTGLAFYTDGVYPAEYRGALFFADYSRNCIWAMLAGADGLPDPAQRRVFAQNAPQPVQLLIGPGHDLYYTSTAGALHRIAALGTDHAPSASFTASPSSGPGPLSVQFDGSTSSDPDPGDSLSYAWDLDGDGAFDDGNAASAAYVYSNPGDREVGLQVTDSRGAANTSFQTVSVLGDSGGPQAQISVSIDHPFQVGELVQFEGSGSEGGLPLPAANLQWDLVIQHCPSSDACHPHVIESFVGASGEFHAPDHEYPYYLQLILRVTGGDGQQSTAVARLDPRTVDVTLDATPQGLPLAFNQAVTATPFSTTVAAGSANSVSAPEYAGFRFSGWSDAGAQSHLMTAPAQPTTLVASYDVSAAAVQLKQYASIIARVTQPQGGGNPSLEVIRDDDYPAPGSADSSRQYDTFTSDFAPKEDWVGYAFPAAHSFSRVVFREGRNFGNGGWFEALEVRVRSGGVWAAVSGQRIRPDYPGTSDNVGFRSYEIELDPSVGDAIGIFGPAGGASHFISIGELDVYGRRAIATSAQAPSAQIAPLSGPVVLGERVTLDARTSFALDGAPLHYTWTQTAGPSVTLQDAGGPTPSFVAPDLDTDATLSFALTVQEGDASSAPASVSVKVAARSSAVDISTRGRISISEPAPTGGGSRDLEIIRDGIEPAVGAGSSSQQFDTFADGASVLGGFVGYEFEAPYRFSSVRFQEGGNFGDGGWFTDMVVQIRQNGRWHDAPDQVSTPPYPAVDDGVSFETYTVAFTPALGDAIRVFGAPGGSAHFFSVAELRAFAVGATAAPSPPLAAAGAAIVVPANTRVTLDGSASWDPDGSVLSFGWQQATGPTVLLTGTNTAAPSFSSPRLTAPTQLSFLLSVRDDSQSSVADRVIVTVDSSRASLDVTSEGAIIASVRRPNGAGARDLEVIRDGVLPAAAATDATLQYDTYTGLLTNQGFIGYQLSRARLLGRLQFQEGLRGGGGGFFATLGVQVLRSGVWRDVEGLRIAPDYASGTSWQSYTLRFAPVIAEGVRITGQPGGAATYFSVAELRAFTP